MANYDPRHAAFETYLAEGVSAGQIAAWLGADLVGPDVDIRSLATYSADRRGSLSFLVGEPSEGGEPERVVLCGLNNVSRVEATTRIAVADPREGFIQVLSRLTPDWVKTTRVQFDHLELEEGPSDIHPSVVIEAGVIIGSGCTIEPGVVIKSGTILGQNSYISANSVIGTHGPALYRSASRVHSYIRLHFGTLQILDGVEVGNGCVVLRGMLGRTLVGRSSILGNMVHIGHGAEIRDHVWMAAGVTVCGHAVVDSYASIAAGCVIRDNIVVGAHASVGMGSVVVRDVEANSSVLGVPARPASAAIRSGPDR